MDSCTVRLVAPEFAGEGEQVPIAIVIQNASREPCELHLQGREILFDITVTGEEGRLVWRKVENFSQAILRLETLSPGGEIRLETMWDQADSSGATVPAGFYTLQGIVPTDGEPLLTQDHLLHITKS